MRKAAGINTVFPAMCIPLRTNIVPTPATIANYNRQREPGPAVDRRLIESRLNHDGWYPTLQSVVGDLGMGLERELSWKSYLADTIHTSSNPVSFRQSFYAKAHADKLDPLLCRALLLRCSQYARQREMGKSLGIYTADELHKSGAAPEGDDVSDGFPVSASYRDIKQSQEDAPLVNNSNPVNAAQAASDMESLLGSAAAEGVGIADLSDLVLQYGPDLMATILKALIDDGRVKFQAGKFYGRVGKSFTIREPI
jgi:hypothetical protein